MRGPVIKRVFARVSIATIVSVAVLVHACAGVWAAPASEIRACSSSQLLIRPMNAGIGAAAGHAGRWYRIHRLWGSACALQGFPRIELLDAGFHSLSVRVGHGGYIIPATLPQRRVIVDRRHDAYFALEITDVRSCHSAPYLMIILPNNKLPVVTYSGGLASCPGEIDSSPVETTPAVR
jgi:hypothetical protein